MNTIVIIFLVFQRIWHQYASFLLGPSNHRRSAGRQSADAANLLRLCMDTRMCSVRIVGCKKQRGVSDCEAIFMSDGDVHVRTGNVGADDD